MKPCHVMSYKLTIIVVIIIIIIIINFIIIIIIINFKWKLHKVMSCKDGGFIRDDGNKGGSMQLVII